jgi:hypothetical protein
MEPKAAVNFRPQSTRRKSKQENKTVSEAIIVSNTQAMQLGGVGMGSSIFRARPQMLELVHKSSHAADVKYGEFRVIGSNEHLGTSIRIVLLDSPQEQREWFIDPTKFSKDNKGCFSLDGLQPHMRAAAPPALYCKTCPKGDINWATWRKTKNPKDLPPCGAYWHLLLADRSTQTPYYLNVKGKSYMPFRQAMEQQMYGILSKVIANVKAENKKLGYTLVKLQQDGGPVYEDFRPTPGVTPTGDPLPMPNIFDVSFEIYSFTKDGGPFQMGFKDFKLMKPEDRADFGQLYLSLRANRAEIDQSVNEETEAAAMVTEIAAAPEAQGEVLPPQPLITI